MNRAWFSLAVLLLGMGLLALGAKWGSSEYDAVERAGLVIGRPITVGNLTVFPVSTRSPKLDDRFITLDEGLRAGTVVIQEIVGGSPAPSHMTPSVPSELPNPDAANPAEVNFDELINLIQTTIVPTSGTLEETPCDETETVDGIVPSQEQVQEVIVEPELLTDDPFGNGNQIGSGNEVNRLIVINRSGKPLYLMPGEVIVGGDQDRTIGREFVIAPTGQPQPIDVFCVEHGRWGGRAASEYANVLAVDSISFHDRRVGAPNLSLAVSQTQTADFDSLTEVITEQANSGKFIGSIGSLNKDVRLAVQKGDGQGAVWNEVSKQNASAGVNPASGAFTANYADGEIAKRLEQYLAELHQPVADTKNVVGVIVAVNGKVESMDVFESTPLFKKLWPKLLKSYALDALKADSDTTTNVCTRTDARRFLNEVASAEATKTESETGLATVQGETDQVLLFTAHEHAALAEQPFVTSVIPVADIAVPISDPVAYPSASAWESINASGGGFGGGIHSSAFSK